MAKQRGNVGTQDKPFIELKKVHRREKIQRLFYYAYSNDDFEDVDYSNLAEVSPSTESVRMIIGSDFAGRRVA